MPKKRKILLITSNHISSNPRLVKESECLVKNNFSISVLSFQSLKSLSEFDTLIAEKNKIKLITIQWFSLKYLVYKPIYKTLRFILNNSKDSVYSKLFFYPSSLILILRGLFIQCDFIIAHNIPALIAAGFLSKIRNIPFGFDAEDFHRGESNTISEKNKNKLIQIENYFLPKSSYITCASPLIEKECKLLFPTEKFETINNVFSSAFIQSSKHNQDSALQLFWFSQTVGPQRGIEEVIRALGFLGNKCDAKLNLLGKVGVEYKSELNRLAAENNVDPLRINWISTVDPDSIFSIAAKMDIGLALETKSIYNRNICLTNKIFTYMTSGLAVIATNTDAQQKILDDFPGFAKIYQENNFQELAEIILFWNSNREDLINTKLKSLELAQTTFNWEIEQEKFLNILKSSLI